MFKKTEPPIVGKAYPICSGIGYRVFDGKAWHNCNKYGERRNGENG